MLSKKDLKLMYLRDTGNRAYDSKVVESTYEHFVDEKELSIEIELKIRGEDIDAIEYTHIVPSSTELGTMEIDVDCVDEDFHNWCVEKLLEFINKNN